MADPVPLKSLTEMALEDVVARFRALFFAAQDISPDSSAWLGLEVLKTALATELERRGQNAAQIWSGLEAEAIQSQERVGEVPFTPRVLDKTVIAIPLLERIRRDPSALYHVIIDVNLEFAGGTASAK